WHEIRTQQKPLFWVFATDTTMCNIFAITELVFTMLYAETFPWTPLFIVSSANVLMATDNL
ncbi:TPA: hypothetical protein ACSP7Z_005349, partial [Serratia fonticola]